MIGKKERKPMVSEKRGERTPLPPRSGEAVLHKKSHSKRGEGTGQKA